MSNYFNFNINININNEYINININKFFCYNKTSLLFNLDKQMAYKLYKDLYDSLDTYVFEHTEINDINEEFIFNITIIEEYTKKQIESNIIIKLNKKTDNIFKAFKLHLYKYVS